MVKRLTLSQKEELKQFFVDGKTIDDLSEIFDFSKLTISRNLKKILGAEIFKEISERNKLSLVSGKIYEKKVFTKNVIEQNNENLYKEETFVEIVPLHEDIDNSNRKDLSSISIDKVDFPPVVYLIVDQNIDLQIKQLNNYPDWQFLPSEDLIRKTLVLYSDIKSAKRDCNKDHKVIKVPNPEVFKIASSILKSKGITRLINEENLISL